MSGTKGMMLTVLLTLMAGKMHDGTPGRDGTYQQEVDEDGEEEEMEEEETGNGEGADGDMSTRVQAARGNRLGMEREDVGGRREMVSFNVQMMKVLEDKHGQEGFMTDIQVRIRKNYGTDPNIFAGILAWRMIEDLDNMSIDEVAVIESNKLHNLMKVGPDSIWKSVDMFNWIVSIDKTVEQLTQLGEDNKQMKRLETLPVMSIIERKFAEQRWQNFRAEVRKYREKDNDNKKLKWNSLSTSLKNIHIRNAGEGSLASVMMSEDVKSTGYKKK